VTTAVRPEPGPPRAYHFPDFERRTLSNGIRVIVAPVRKLPVVSMMAIIDAGAICDPPGCEGLAQLTARALVEGTRTLDGQALTERLEGIGASVDPTTDWDYVAASTTVMTDRAHDALALLAEVIIAPSFPDREIERLRNERHSELLQQRAEPRGLADEMFSRFLYGADSRYAEPEGGNERSIMAITRDDIVAFHRDWYRPGGTTLIIAGDIGVADALQLVESKFGSWNGSGNRTSVVRDRPASMSRRVYIIGKDDAPQSEVRVGHVGVPRSHPDYFAIVIMNAILGGLFSSRINLNLREAHAYTYGAYSHYDWRRGAGPFVVSTAVKSDVTDGAVREVLHEIERMREAEPTPQELSLATSYLDGVFPIRYETTSAIAGALAGLVVYGLPDDYFDRYRDQIRSVTSADVLAAARRHLHPEQLQVAVVGDRSAVRGPLEQLALGPMVLLDSEGKTIGG
jgi:predicted Zn-dependent peptidase